ncbi:MAG TPA: hypothetical protein VLV88_08310 [Terriglobales bacterium]|nr:hypothetical protein [Terriglobales bacterium]
MLTLFSTAKPFEGHSAIIQRNALKSWTLLHPEIEVILFGDDPGAAETARELGIRHVPEVERVPQGPKVLRSFFDAAQRIARHDILCYANCDIVLTPDFFAAVATLRKTLDRFLMIGRRWDTDIGAPLPFEQNDWAAEVRKQALEANHPCAGTWIDYFVFPKGFYLGKLPAFVIGRVVWDHWLVWKARASGLPVVDASEGVIAIHQNHDYGYHPGGAGGVWSDDLAQRNRALAGSHWHLATMDDATHLLGATGVRRNPRSNAQALRRFIRNFWQTARLAMLDWTRPTRHALGLRKRRAGADVPLERERVPETSASSAESYLFPAK